MMSELKLGLLKLEVKSEVMDQQKSNRMKLELEVEATKVDQICLAFE